MLASGAILDYGSIRQFAAKHDKYRYKDVDRYSASLTEQRHWARVIVQTFAQAMAFITSGEKQNLREFKDDGCLKVFDAAFEHERNFRILWRLGFTPAQIDELLLRATSEITEFRKSLTYFEDLKISKGVEKLPDGLTHKPVFLIRNLLRQLPAYFVAQALNRVDDESAFMPGDVFLSVMAASYVGKRDLRLTRSRNTRVRNFQRSYLRLLARLDEPLDEVLRTLQERSAVINHRHRLTGDALVHIIEDVIAAAGKLKVKGLQEALDAFIDSQVLIPGSWQPVAPDEFKPKTVKSRLLVTIQENLEEFKESV